MGKISAGAGLFRPRSPIFLNKRKIIAGFMLLLAILFFTVPILHLTAASFVSRQTVTLQNYLTVLKDPGTLTSIKNTLYIVTGATILALILGVALGWLLAYSDIRLKRLLQAFAVLPFLIPSYIVTISWTQFTDKGSWFTHVVSRLFHVESINLYSYMGIIIVLAISHYPLILMMTITILRHIPRDLEWAARSSGGGWWTVLRKVTFPLAYPGILGGGLIVFLTNLDNFGIPAFLGIPANITVLSTDIYKEIVGFGPDAFSRAAALSMLMGAMALAATGLQWLLLKKSNHVDMEKNDRLPRFSLGKYRWLVELAIWGFVLLISIVPLFSMIGTSLTRTYGLPLTLSNLTLEHYHYVLFDYNISKTAALHSLELAFLTMILCLVIGTAIAYYRIRKNNKMGRFIEFIIGLPYTLPGSVIAIAMILTWMEPIPGWNPGIYGSLSILVIAYITRFMFLQFQSSSAALSQISPEWEEASHISGAGGLKKWRYILTPLLFNNLLSGALLVFLMSLTELTVSTLLSSSGTETIGVTIFNFEQSGETANSTAFSMCILLLMLFMYLFVLASKKIWERKVFMHGSRD